jgi:hypothetical protein
MMESVIIRPNTVSLERTDKPVPQEERDEVWEITIKGGKASCSRMIAGQVVESYRPVSLDKAVLDVVSIIQGFELPRHHKHLDKPLIKPNPASANNDLNIRGLIS